MSKHVRVLALRPMRSSSLWTETEEDQEDRPPDLDTRRLSSATMSAESVCIGCASGVAYTRVFGLLTSCRMSLHGAGTAPVGCLLGIAIRS